MFLKALKIALLSADQKENIIGRFFKALVLIIISPFIAVTLLVGGIFSNGIGFNHHLVSNLFNGNPISDFVGEKAEYIQTIQDGLMLIDNQISNANATFTTSASLNEYLVKGYFIGFMFSNQQRKFDSASAEAWVNSFIVKENDNVYPTSVNTVIYDGIQSNMGIQLENDTVILMEKVYGTLIGNSNGIVVTLTQEQIRELIDQLPDNISELRKNIVLQAADAVGKIPYYWGGTASNPGYEGNDFGAYITPDEKGRNRKGLDCSHFVDWVYWTVMENNLGNTNTAGQIKMCRKISANELLPGDLAFLMDENGQTTHVGIYAGMNESGQLVWIHENANDNNVAVNTVSYWSGYYRLNFMEGR